VTVDQSPVAALADASDITGLPRDNFEVHEISKGRVRETAGIEQPVVKGPPFVSRSLGEPGANRIADALCRLVDSLSGFGNAVSSP
jgi:hypothetical protein